MKEYCDNWLNSFHAMTQDKTYIHYLTESFSVLFLNIKIREQWDCLAGCLLTSLAT